MPRDTLAKHKKLSNRTSKILPLPGDHRNRVLSSMHPVFHDATLTVALSSLPITLCWNRSYHTHYWFLDCAQNSNRSLFVTIPSKVPSSITATADLPELKSVYAS
jgi:hypothetical protein